VHIDVAVRQNGAHGGGCLGVVCGGERRSVGTIELMFRRGDVLVALPTGVGAMFPQLLATKRFVIGCNGPWRLPSNCSPSQGNDNLHSSCTFNNTTDRRNHTPALAPASPRNTPPCTTTHRLLITTR
jgi:hypothetical protein